MPFRRGYPSRKRAYRGYRKRRSFKRGMRRSYTNRRRPIRNTNAPASLKNGAVLIYRPSASKAWLPGVLHNTMYSVTSLQISKTIVGNNITELFIVRANDMISGIEEGSGAEVGIRPQGFNEMTLLYENWNVTATAIRFEMFGNATQNETNPITVIATWKNSTAGPTTISAALAERGSVSKIVFPWFVGRTASVLSTSATTKGVFGASTNTIEEFWGANETTQPSKRTNCIFSAYSADPSDTTVALTGILHITYSVKWWKPDRVPLSTTGDGGTIILS